MLYILQVDGYLHNEEEKHYKKIIWELLNREYLEVICLYPMWRIISITPPPAPHHPHDTPPPEKKNQMLFHVQDNLSERKIFSGSAPDFSGNMRFC